MNRLRWRVRQETAPAPAPSAKFTQPVRLVNNEEPVKPAAPTSRSHLKALQPVSSGPAFSAPALDAPALPPATATFTTEAPSPSDTAEADNFHPAAISAAPALPEYKPAISTAVGVRQTSGFGTPSPAEPELAPARPSSRRGYEYNAYQLDESADMEMEEEGEGDFADCPNKFNDRNCCEDGETCNKSRAIRAGNSIRNISLNITPLFKPDAAGDIDLAEEQSKGLSKVTSRTWTNRSGAVIANGRFDNYINGRVVVLTDTGAKQQIPFYTLSDTDMCYVDAWWGLPTECTLGDVAYHGRHFTPSTFTWKASALCHKPLYFEERALERYGHSNGPWRQPVVSAAHFFLNLATVPYQMGIHPPFECQYALGYYRPGSCAPWMVPAIPISPRGALYQTGAVLGGVFLLP